MRFILKSLKSLAFLFRVNRMILYARYDDRYYDREGHSGTSRLVLSCYLARCLRDISPRGSIDRSDGRTVAVLRRWINGITGSVNNYGN